MPGLICRGYFISVVFWHILAFENSATPQIHWALSSFCSSFPYSFAIGVSISNWRKTMIFLVHVGWIIYPSRIPGCCPHVGWWKSMSIHFNPILYINSSTLINPSLMWWTQAKVSDNSHLLRRMLLSMLGVNLSPGWGCEQVELLWVTIETGTKDG